ncbi:uncharacterized protein METZ01_LOCUS405684, partial [marine metagenome]
MTAEGSRLCKFTQLVPDHVFSNKYGNMLSAVMHLNG